MEMLPEIANQLKLDQSVRVEGEQPSLFTPGQQERADARVAKQRRNLLERRIASRKGKKLTMEEWKAHQQEVDELKALEKELPGIEARGKKSEKATTPYGKEVAPEATAFTRSTSEEFIALVESARKKREEAAGKAKKELKNDKDRAAEVARALGVLNAHIDAMGARLQVLVNAVKQARSIATRAGRCRDPDQERHAPAAQGVHLERVHAVGQRVGEGRSIAQDRPEIEQRSKALRLCSSLGSRRLPCRHEQSNGEPRDCGGHAGAGEGQAPAELVRQHVAQQIGGGPRNADEHH